MPSLIQVGVHPSQFPDRVEADLLACLRRKRLDPKFHYQSYKQAEKWLRLHRAYSPWVNDPSCVRAYERAFLETARLMAGNPVQLVGLGCGPGTKEALLLKELRAVARPQSYLPVDVSLSLVLSACRNAGAVLPNLEILPIVGDLALPDLSDYLPRASDRKCRRLVTLFGVIPNLEPLLWTTQVKKICRPGDYLLLSGNLAGNDPQALKRILGLYDNVLTRDWLLVFIEELGIASRNGRVLFKIQKPAAGKGVPRIAAFFIFQRKCEVSILNHHFLFKRGTSFLLFFSYRYSCQSLKELLSRQGFNLLKNWNSDSEEEGIFLFQRQK